MKEQKINWLLVLTTGLLSVIYNTGVMGMSPFFQDYLVTNWFTIAISGFFTGAGIVLMSNIILVILSKIFEEKQMVKKNG